MELTADHEYLPAVRAVHGILKIAMAEATALLPEAIRTQHWIAGHHSPAAWRSVEAWLRTQESSRQQDVDIVSDLALLADALSCVSSVVLRARGPMGSLKLAKVRRSG